MRVVIIVQARMGSSRFPGKVLKKVLDKPLLEYQLERLRRVRLAHDIVIATTTDPKDDAIVTACQIWGVHVYRGSEEDVLSRYYETARLHHADVVVRITADCPLIDPRVVDDVIRRYLEQAELVDYVSNTLQRSYPRGMDTEAFSFEVLEEAYFEASQAPEREHVTPFIYRHPERYRLANVIYASDQSHHRWTVDTPEDFQLIERILQSIYPKNPYFTLEDVLDLLTDHPEWIKINSHIQQKELGLTKE